MMTYLIAALGKERQADLHEFEASQCCIERPCPPHQNTWMGGWRDPVPPPKNKWMDGQAAK